MANKTKKKIVSWWSGGVTSAITCHLCIEIFGLKNCEFIFIDTYNEDDDTYRFKKDCEQWYGKKIKTISAIGDGKYNSIQDVWRMNKTLNVATGAKCSADLKRLVREKWEKTTEFDHQAFGFDINESKRAKSISMNHPRTKPIFPLLFFGLAKAQCLEMLVANNIDAPRTYALGYHNNNCFKTGCVQGGIGYWQKIQREYPDKFEAMASMEHELTDSRGEPVTMLKDQGADALISGNVLVFLKPHPKYPHMKDLSMMEGKEPKPLMECNGFCSSNDLEERNPTENEINYNQTKLFY